METIRKILVVDDVHAIVKKEKTLLSRSGFTILTATSGEEALRIHRAERVDLILTDLDMPGMNGDDLCSLIRRDGELRNVSVIIVCHNRESAIRRCEASAANSFIIKPIDLQILFQRISELLNIPARLSMRFLVQVNVKGKYKDKTFFSSSRNVSSGGILLESEKILDKGDPIEISFFLGTRQVFPKGEIVRVTKAHQNLYHYGVKFTDIDSSSRAVIENYVNRLLTR